MDWGNSTQKASAINNVVPAVANITQIAGEVLDVSPQTMQMIAAAELTTSFANVGTSSAQLTDINFKREQ